MTKQTTVWPSNNVMAELPGSPLEIPYKVGFESMAFPVVEFSREGYKIRKVFG